MNNSTSSNRIQQHLDRLSREIGCRAVGSDGNQAASQYIESTFNELGLDVEVQEFQVPKWKQEDAYLEFNGNRYKATANSFSTPCYVSGEVIPFCTLEELSSASDLTGKIALLYGELAKENYVPKGFTIYNPEHHQKTIQLLEEKNPSAILFTRMQVNSDLPLLNDWDFQIPSLTISPELGLDIMKNHVSFEITCVINTTRTPGKTKNIIGRIGDCQDAKIILSAHYDTVFQTNGAFDNASGVSLLLSLAEEISKNMNATIGFEFIAFSSEEFLGLGDHFYLEDHYEQLKNTITAMNFDGIGQLLGTNTITLMAGSNELESLLRNVKEAFPAVQWTNPWYESNHYTFFSNGVPSIPFNCTGVDDLLHTPKDNTEWISSEKIKEVQSLALEIIRQLKDKNVSWTRTSK